MCSLCCTSDYPLGFFFCSTNWKVKITKWASLSANSQAGEFRNLTKGSLYSAVKSKISLSAETFYRGKLRKTVCRYSNLKSYHEKRNIFRKHIWNSSQFFDIFNFFSFPCFAVEKVDRALFLFSKLFQTSKKKPNYIMAGFIKSLLSPHTPVSVHILFLIHHIQTANECVESGSAWIYETG